MIRIIFVTFLLSSVCFQSFASNRSANQFGIILGLDTPFPTVAAGNVAYNLGDLARVTAGYGSISATTTDASLNSVKLTASTIGGALNFFLPSWNFSPTVGIGYATVDVTLTGTSTTTQDVGGFSESDSHAYLTYGFDWTASNGFNFALGMNTSLKSGVGSLFYLNLGWFF